jgi:hypothetical protein
VTGLVYLASYPRSGNTLLRMILWQCFGLKTVSQYDESARIATCPEWLSLLGTVEHWDKTTTRAGRRARTRRRST